MTNYRTFKAMLTVIAIFGVALALGGVIACYKNNYIAPPNQKAVVKVIRVSKTYTIYCWPGYQTLLECPNGTRIIVCGIYGNPGDMFIMQVEPDCIEYTEPMATQQETGE